MPDEIGLMTLTSSALTKVSADIRREMESPCIWGHAGAVARRVYGTRKFPVKRTSLWAKIKKRMAMR